MYICAVILKYIYIADLSIYSYKYIYIYGQIYRCIHKISIYRNITPSASGWQESNNSLAPITVKLGSFSEWNRSRDFNRVVKLPLDGDVVAEFCFQKGLYNN